MSIIKVILKFSKHRVKLYFFMNKTLFKTNRSFWVQCLLLLTITFGGGRKKAEFIFTRTTCFLLAVSNTIARYHVQGNTDTQFSKKTN